MTRLTLTVVATLATLATLATTVALGLAAGVTADQQRPVFRAGVNLVSVDVYPRRDGRLVEDLRAEDFEILEDGVPQAVDTFEFIRNGDLLTEGDRRDPPSLDDGNRQASDPNSRVFVLYLDRYHTHIEGTRTAADFGVEFLRRVAGARDLFGLLTPEVPASQMALRRDLQSLERNVRTYWDAAFVSRASESIPEPGSPHEATLYRCFIQRTGDPQTDDALVRRLLALARVEQVLNNLSELSRRLSALRELRSHVLLFSSGWRLAGPSPDLAKYAWDEIPQVGVNRLGRLTLDRDQPDGPANKATCDSALLRLANLDFRFEFDDLLRVARQSNVSIHVVDPGGLAAFDDGVGGIGRPLDWLRSLASGTDGAAVVGTSGMRQGLIRLADDLKAYYLLGYYSTNGAADGRYRRIQVRARVPDVDIVARRGYLAPTAEQVRQMDAARDTADEQAESGLTESLAELARLDRSPDLFVDGVTRGNEIVLSAEATPGALGRFLATGAAVEYQVTGQAGTPAAERRWTLEPGDRSTLVRLPKPAGESGPWNVLFRLQGGSQPITERLTVADRPAAPIAAPLVFRATSSRRSPLWPAPSREFRRNERIRVEWRASGPLDTREARLLGRDGNPLAVPVTVTESADDGTPLLAVDLTLAPLAPGDYVIEVTASAGADSVRTLVSFRVTG